MLFAADLTTLPPPIVYCIVSALTCFKSGTANLQKIATVFAYFCKYLEHLFSPLGKLADWAIYFTFYNFFKLTKNISPSTKSIFTIFLLNGR